MNVFELKEILTKQGVLSNGKIYPKKYKPIEGMRSVKEALWCVRNKQMPPRCPYCGKEVYFRGSRGNYSKTCGSKECSVKAHKDTMIQKYGTSNLHEVPSIKEKINKTFQEKYGGNSPYCSQEVKDKVKKTNLERYNSETPFGNKEIHDKAMKTRDGKKAYEKVKETMKERYGVEYALQNPEFLEKMRLTNQERFGVDWARQVPEIVEKGKQTFIERYGVSTYAETEEFKDFVKEKWSQRSPEEISEIFSKRKTKYEYEGEYFDSSWELAFYKYHKEKGEEISRLAPTFEYTTSDGVKRHYTPDFIWSGKLVEIKGDQYFDEKGNLTVPYTNRLQGDELKLEQEKQSLKQKIIEDKGILLLREKDIKEELNAFKNNKKNSQKTN